MTPVSPSYRAPSRSPAPVGLIAIVVLVLGFAIGVPILQWTVQTRVQAITGDALASVQAVDRMRLDLHREEFILQAHVHATDAGGMASLGKQIAAVENDFAATAHDYDQLAMFPGEAHLWTQFRHAAEEYREAAAHVLALSIQNRDALAQASLDAVLTLLSQADDAGERLAQFNVEEGRKTEVEIRRILLCTNSGVVGIALVVVVLSLTIGARVLKAEARAERTAQEVLTLEERNKELDAFAGRVAHDLRGPLQSLNLSSATLPRRVPQEEATAQVITRAVKRLEAIVRDLLALSGVSGASLVGSCDPAAAAAEVREELQPRLETEGATLRVEMEPGQISCSPGLVRQAIWNLVDNALKYRQPDVPVVIEIHGRVNDDLYELRVSDNGSGMSEEDARHVFKPLYRGAHALKGPPGTGLGLAIVKRVADAAGGQVSVASEIGRGTTFVLRLPCQRGSPGGQRVSRREQLVPSEPS